MKKKFAVIAAVVLASLVFVAPAAAQEPVAVEEEAEVEATEEEAADEPAVEAEASLALAIDVGQDSEEGEEEETVPGALDGFWEFFGVVLASIGPFGFIVEMVWENTAARAYHLLAKDDDEKPVQRLVRATQGVVIIAVLIGVGIAANADLAELSRFAQRFLGEGNVTGAVALSMVIAAGAYMWHEVWAPARAKKAARA